MPTPPAAILFPGQGSQTPGMRADVERICPELLEHALNLLGRDPYEHLDDGTHMQQPAVYCASIAGWRSIQAHEPELCEPPALRLLAGHSLGEVAALVAGGVLGPEEGLRLVVIRGRLMHEAALSSAQGGMAAIAGGATFGGPLAERLGLTVANDNSPDQVVLSGRREALATAVHAAREEGRRAVLLPIRGAFHSEAMAGASRAFAGALRDFELRPPRVPVMSCVTARPFEDVAAGLVDSLVRGVRWRDVLAYMAGAGVERFVEAGPGRVLTRLVSKNLEGVVAETAEQLAVAHA